MLSETSRPDCTQTLRHMPGERHHLQHHYDAEQYCEGYGLNGYTKTPYTEKVP